MHNLSRALVVGVLALMAYLVVNDVQATDVVAAVGQMTDRAQDFADEVEFEGETEFRSIEDQPVVSDEIAELQELDGTFFTLPSGDAVYSQGPAQESSSALAFGLDLDTETDLSVDAPAKLARQAAQPATDTVPATTAAPTPTTAAPTTTQAPATTAVPAPTTQAPETAPTTTTEAPTAPPETTEAPTTTTEAPPATEAPATTEPQATVPPKPAEAPPAAE